MPANRDKSQRFTFVYTNLYALYKDSDPQKAKEAAERIIAKRENNRAPSVGGTPGLKKIVPSSTELKKALSGMSSAQILAAARGRAKTGLSATDTLRTPSLPRFKEQSRTQSPSQTKSYFPIHHLDSRAKKISSELKEKPLSGSSAVESLKKNLGRLTDLHEKLQFMLSELEELSRDPKDKK